MDLYRCLNCGHPTPESGSCPRCRNQALLSGRFRVPDPGGGWIRNYGTGWHYYILGFKFLSEHPRLFKFILIPLVVSLVVFAGMIFGAVLLIPQVLSFLDAEWFSWLEWLRHLLYWVAYILLALLSILASFFMTLFFSSVINSPFYDFLSEKVEEIYLGRSFEEKWSVAFIQRNIILPIKESLKLALFELAVILVLFILSLVSAGLGTILFALAGPYMASLTIFDFTMARKLYNLEEKKRFLKANLAFAMGFGTPAYLVPFLTPFAVVGATLGFLSTPHK